MAGHRQHREDDTLQNDTLQNDTLQDDNHRALVNEYEIMHLIYHRNYNQHRLLHWWKYFNILHRYIRKMIVHLYDGNMKEVQLLADRMKKKKFFTKCYYEFNGIIRLGQFITLGMALIGCLSKVYDLITPYMSGKASLSQTIEATQDTEELGEEIGEPMEVNTGLDGGISSIPESSLSPMDIDNAASKQEKRPEKHKSSNKPKKDKTKKEKTKKKKNKSDIDMIFG